MADNPYAQYATNPYAVYGTPREPTPQTPAQSTGDVLQNARTQQQIESQPLQNENTRVNIAQGQTSIQNQRFNQNQGLRQEYNALPEVKNYSAAIQSLGTALKAPDSPQGDLSIVYAFAKAMDPGSVVREGEMDMATATASIPQAYQADVARLTQGKRLPPAVRTGLIEAMRQSVSGLRQNYDQQRGRYESLAQQNGFDPAEIVGKPLYDAYRPAEEAYITAHGGTPRDPNAPVSASTAPKVGEFGGEQDPRLTELNPAQKAAYDAWWKANPNPSPEQLQQFGSTISLNIPSANAADIVAAKKAGRGLSSDIQAIPDISKERGQGGVGETADAAIRGFTDVPTFGLADKIAAAGDTLTDPGSTFRGNLARQYAISDYDTQNHPVARGVGQLGGAFAVPMGEINSLGQLALKGGAVGAAYGVGSSRSLSDIPQNALMNGAVGATAPVGLTLIGRGGKAAINALRGGPKEIPPLVDPMTGELNQPLDASPPAARYQALSDYGIQNPPMAAVGGRTARTLDVGLTNLPPSAGVMEDAATATGIDLRRAVGNMSSRYGQGRNQMDMGTAAQQGLTKWIARAEGERGNPMDRGVIGRAYDAISISPTAQTIHNGTVAALQELSGRMEGNPALAGLVNNPKFGSMLEDVQKNGLSWQNMKALRSWVGDKIGEMRFGENDSTSDFRHLYAALSQDMEATAADQGPRALREFRRANGLNKAVQDRIENAFTTILGPDAKGNPQAAAGKLMAMTSGQAKGNLTVMRQIYASTRKGGEWGDVSSAFINLMGQPAQSQGRAFDPGTFVRNYADMSAEARSMIFGAEKTELRKALDGFVQVNQQLSKVKALQNSSNTTPSFLGARFVQGLSGGAAVALFMNPLMTAKAAVVGGALAAGDYGIAKLWTSPAFVKWASGYSRAAASGNQNAVKSQVGRLSKLAATDPELRAPIEGLLKSIANDNAVPSIAASSNPDGDQNQQ